MAGRRPQADHRPPAASRPRIVFCVDAGDGVGLGHLRRCATLGAALRRRHAAVRFAVPGAAGAEYLQRHGIEDVEAQDLGAALAGDHEGDDVVVVDAYGVPGGELERVRGARVAVIDDLADRELRVALVVNGAPHASDLRYRVAAETRLLRGPRYILLREEFGHAPAREIRPAIERVLITVGGTDPEGITTRLLGCVRETLGSVAVDVVLGPFFPRWMPDAVEAVAGRDGLRLHRDPPYIRDLMIECDVAIAAGGQTTYELAATGTPAVAVAVADNQLGNLAALEALGTLRWAGRARDPGLEGLVAAGLRELEGSARRQAMANAGRCVVDGGGADRVAEAILEVAGA